MFKQSRPDTFRKKHTQTAYLLAVLAENTATTRTFSKCLELGYPDNKLTLSGAKAVYGCLLLPLLAEHD